MKKILSDRADYIAKNESECEESYASAQKFVEDKNTKIAQANSKSAEILSSTSEKLQKNYDERIKETRLNSNIELEKNAQKLDEEKISAENILKREIGNYASIIISKILKKDVSVVNMNDEIVNKALRGEL